MRTVVYVDGFNFYFGVLKRTPYRWLDLQRLFALTLARNRITLVRYFTARVQATPRNPGIDARQDAYLRALAAACPLLTVHYGHYVRRVLSMEIMLLRPTTPADLPLLQRWDEQPHVLASDPNDDWGWESELHRSPDWREWLIAEVDGRPVGFIQIIDPAREDSHYWGEVPPNLRAIDLWIGEASDLGRGHGTRMMRLALARCFAPPQVTAVLVDPLESNTRSHRFYEPLGFRYVERRRFGRDDCRVYRLERKDWQDPGPGRPYNPQP